MTEETFSKPPIEELLRIMARLRDPNGGCPWDIEQDFKSITPYTLEEAYEVVDAVERGDMDGLKEELGDLLLQVVFHSQMANEQNLFTFEDVVQSINHKLISRHPHVFGDVTAKNAEDVLHIWNAAKDREKQDSKKKMSFVQKDVAPPSILDDIPVNFPSLMRAQKISRRAAKSGFEWSKTEDVIDKIIEELNEFRAEIHSGDQEKQAEELGDVFFTLVNLGRRLDIDCDGAMRSCNEKFYRRFSGMERDVTADGKSLKDLTADEWEAYWQRQKSKEKKTCAPV
ncbi:MAG: nucleoside triphosphate pyrophosphohydrolase [Pseudobdellovibrionaceae bacterium]|jgi:MazG family protein|nr:nucleoside triphosphate pyrophosphohydrolase [Pseudobdellovibrionaceae bacterium]